MIQLDTNYLIELAVPGSTAAQIVDAWLASGESLAASSLAWTEFLNGPVTATEIQLAETIIENRVLPFEKQTAVLASDLFNRTGHKRGTRFDCLIAASAISSGGALATANKSDFAQFVPHGLTLL